MKKIELDEGLIERMKPWALVLRYIRYRIVYDDYTPFGEMIKDGCKQAGVDYPPFDVEAAILTHVFRWSVADLPIPVEENV